MSDRNLTEPDVVVRAVTVIMAAVVGLTFLFGFGNVLNLALRLGVPGWVAPLVAPAVDLSVVGLLLGTRHLAVHGATPAQLCPARRLLIFSSVVALALNTADPIIAGQFGKAAFDAVGPFLLIGWAEVGPGLLAAITTARTTVPSVHSEPAGLDLNDHSAHQFPPAEGDNVKHLEPGRTRHELLDQARREDLDHWHEYQRPISAETLRRRLRVGARTSRDLVAIMRSEYGIGAGHASDRQHA